MIERALPGRLATKMGERLAGAYLDHLSKGLARSDGVAERDMLRSVGWLIACREDDRLPVDVAARLVPGFSTHPAVRNLTRFMLIRSVRCRRLQQAYRDQARVLLHLQREKLNDDFRPALWGGVLHLLEGRLSEARRAFEAADRLSAGEQTVAAALALSRWLLGERWTVPGSGRSADEAVWGDLSVVSLTRAQDPAGVGGRRVGFRLEGVLAATGDLSAGWAATLDVRAVAGAPVTIKGPGGTRTLTPLEGELLLAFLSLVSAPSSAEDTPVRYGAAGGREEDRPATGEPRALWRERWTCAIWPSVPGAVGRMDGLFSAAIRSLRLKASAAARRPVLEVSRRGLYQILPDVSIRLSMDVPSFVANWLMVRTPPDPAGGGDQAAPNADDA